MADNARVTPLVKSLVGFTGRQIDTAAQILGKSLPCVVEEVLQNGKFVTVSFQVVTDGQSIPNATMPIATSRYIRFPVAVGDIGVAIAADARLSGITGLGAGVADLSVPANLAALLFIPLSTRSFPAQPPNRVLLVSPDGALIQNDAGTAIMSLTSTAIILSVAGHTLTIDASGIKLDGIAFATHVHGGVRSGGDDTGPPV